ncbi:MAG: CoA transferase, partial [Pseudomonadota bacterium]
PMGSAHPLNAPYEAFKTADRWITIGGANQRNWLRILDVVGATHLADDPRFTDNAARMANRMALADALAPFLAKRTSADWLAAFAAAGVPAGPVLDIAEMHAHPQTEARDMAPSLNHPIAGAVRTLGAPVKFSKTPGGVHRCAPRLGEHTFDVLREAGMTTTEIEAMIDRGDAIAL